MRDIVTMRDAIAIFQPVETVFAFVSDGANDPKWRTEVDRMHVSGPPRLGTSWTEYTRFFAVLHMVTPAVVTEYKPPHRVVVETPRDHPAWLQSVREIKARGPKEALLSYQLAFERALMLQLSPIMPPASFISWFYLPRIAKYLRNAKRILEATHHSA